MLAIKQFELEAKAGLRRSLYFLLSSEPFFLSEANRLIRENFQTLAIETYEDPEKILKETKITSGSLFSSRRILLVENFERLRKKEIRIEILAEVLNRASSSVSVVFFTEGSAKEFSEEIALLKKSKEAMVLNLDVSDRDILHWIYYRAEKAQIKLKPDAALYMVSITGGQPGLIASEIEKLGLLCSGRTLSLFDIKELLTELGEFDAFDLVDAVKRRDVKKAFELIEKLKSFDSDLILGALNYYYGQIEETDEKTFRSLLRANLSLRQGKLCSLELLLYELLRSKNKPH